MRTQRYWIDLAFLERYGAELGPYGIAVYNALACCATQTNEEFFVANQSKIAEITGMCRPVVNRRIKKLRNLGLVNIKRLRNGYLRYQLPRPSARPSPQPKASIELPPCVLCGATEELVCHHIKGCKVDNNDIVYLCAACHHQVHHGEEVEATKQAGSFSWLSRLLTRSMRTS